MLVRKLDIDIVAELEAAHARRIKHRSEGRHQSEIIHYIVKRMDPKRFGGPLDTMLIQAGFIWEDVFSYVLSRQLGGRQLEVEKDGILITLDGMNTRAWRPREYKATKISARNPIASNRYWHWHIQGKGQCHAIDADEIEFIPVYLNGSYELGGGRFGLPISLPKVVTYTKLEKQENWEMLCRTRDRMDREKVA